MAGFNSATQQNLAGQNPAICQNLPGGISLVQYDHGL